jgi:orotate phosphoribosyltransferase
MIEGLELGGVPLAVVISQVCGLPAIFVRKQAKTYGRCRLAEGGVIEGRRLAIVEDVVTSGGRVIDSCRELRARGADIAAVLCVIDREAAGRANLTSEQLELRSLFTMSELEEGWASIRDAGLHSAPMNPAEESIDQTGRLAGRQSDTSRRRRSQDSWGLRRRLLTAGSARRHR